jgi:TonB-linked SusC/RagA family outer membrane protein
MLKKVLASLVFSLLVAPAALAQTGTVEGTVTDAETGETVAGANVALTEISQGAATTAEGEYTIEGVPAGTYTLRVTFVGYQAFRTQVTVEANQTITRDVELQPQTVGLEEVTVSGYGGPESQAEVTGSVSNVSTEDIQDIPAQNAQQLLQGRATGIQISTTSGNPGGGFEVNIRGEGSITAGNDPLYIVDGIQVNADGNSELTDRSPINNIAPSDIESIQILKDAAAAAIYGAQAANGVVLITTKSGRQGRTQVNLRYEGGVRFQSERFDLMNRDEWIDFQVDAFGEQTVRNGILPSFGYDPSTPFNELRNFDWQDWLFQPGGHNNVGFSASGGSEATQFYISGNWTNTGGALQAGAVTYNQWNFNTTLTQELTDALSLTANVKLSNEDQRNVCQDGFFINCPFYQAIGEEPPISYPYLDDGSYNPFTEQSPTTNPALFLNEEDRGVGITQIVGKLSPEYRIAPWLTARGTFGIDWSQVKENDYESPTRAPSAGGFLSRRFSNNTKITANATLDAQRTFSDVHNVSLLAGSEYVREFEFDDETGFIGFNNSLLKVPAAANEVSFFQGFNTEFRLLSFFGRARYNYDNRYIATVTGRVDGVSRFGSDRRFGFFPSGSVAWRVSEESFFQVDAVDDLKLRVSLASNGNSDIGNFPARGLFGVGGSYEGTVGFNPGQLANPLLTWEEKNEVNLGLDWSLFSGRISGSFDAYRAVTDNLLLNRPLPISSGFGSITENIGSVRNRGLEFSLETVNVRTEAFRWSTRFNISVNENTVLELTEGAEALNPGNALPVEVGRSLEGWSVPLWAGVNPADGRPMYYDADGNITYQPDNADNQPFDGGEEDVIGGVGTRLTYGGLSLDVYFDYSFGAKGFPQTQSSWTAAFGEGVLGELDERRWREPGDIASWPRSTPFGSFDSATDPGALTSLWLYKANYIRLKNVSLSYRLPSVVTDRLGLRSTRVYVSGINVVDWSPYLGIDPEVGGAFEASSYPAEQQVNFGIELGL